jgi:hypothetical protein
MQTDFAFNAERIWRICKRCVFVMDTPDETTFTKYNFATAMLLFGTAAQEGNLRWERQRSPTWNGEVGGFSKWQVELGSIQATRNGLRGRDHADRLKRAIKLIFNDPNATGEWLTAAPVSQLLWALRMEDNDHLGVLFAREHYKRVPAAIPISPTGVTSYDQIQLIANYWKKYYNTFLGAGTPDQFYDNYKKYCASVVGVDPLLMSYTR